MPLLRLSSQTPLCFPDTPFLLGSPRVSPSPSQRQASPYPQTDTCLVILLLPQRSVRDQDFLGVGGVMGKSKCPLQGVQWFEHLSPKFL